MKKTLLSIITVCLLSFNSIAQTCTPDENITGTISPSTSAGVQSAQVDVDFEQTFHFKIIKDTALVIDGFGNVDVTVNHLIIDSISGLPSNGQDGFEYNCTPSNCTFPAETFGCLILYGTPWEELGGTTIPIQIHATLNGTGMVFGNPINNNMPLVFDFDIEVLPRDIQTNTNSIGKKNQLQVFPNPTSDVATLKVNSLEKGTLQVNIVNLLGVRVFSESNNNFDGIYNKQISKNKLGTGIFFVSVIINGKETVSKLIIK